MVLIFQLISYSDLNSIVFSSIPSDPQSNNDFSIISEFNLTFKAV